MEAGRKSDSRSQIWFELVPKTRSDLTFMRAALLWLATAHCTPRQSDGSTLTADTHSLRERFFFEAADRFQAARDLAEGFLCTKGPAGSAELPNLVSNWVAKGDYKSQFGQDQFIATQLNTTTGTHFYLDLGCNNGISASNTFYYEMRLGWQGACVEADPETFGRIASASGRRSGVNVAVSDHDGPVNFTRALGDPGGGHNGISDSLDGDKVEEMGGGTTTITVDGMSVRSLLAKYYPDQRTIDYVSIDIEGAELTVLRAWPWDEWCVNAFTVEDNACKDMVRRRERAPLPHAIRTSMRQGAATRERPHPHPCGSRAGRAQRDPLARGLRGKRTDRCGFGLRQDDRVQAHGLTGTLRNMQVGACNFP